MGAFAHNNDKITKKSGNEELIKDNLKLIYLSLYRNKQMKNNVYVYLDPDTMVTKKCGSGSQKLAYLYITHPLVTRNRLETRY